MLKNKSFNSVSPGAGLSKYTHQASHRICAGTPSTLFGCIQQDPPTTPVLRKTPLQSFIVYTLVTLSTPSPESCTIIKILHTVHLKYYPLSVLYFIFVVLEIPVITQQKYLPELLFLFIQFLSTNYHYPISFLHMLLSSLATHVILRLTLFTGLQKCPLQLFFLNNLMVLPLQRWRWSTAKKTP